MVLFRGPPHEATASRGEPTQILWAPDLIGLGITVDATTVYWEAIDFNAPLGDHASVTAIFAVSPDGSSPRIVVADSATEDAYVPWPPAVSRAGIFWIERDLVAGGAKLRTVPVDGGAPVTLVDRFEGKGPLIADESEVHWSCGEEHRSCWFCPVRATLCSIPIAGGPVTRLDVTKLDESPLAVSGGAGTFVTGEGWIAQLNSDGGLRYLAGSREQPAPGLYPGVMTADDANVYWFNNGDASIRMLPIGKP